MVEIIFIIVGIVLAAIGIAAAHESEEDFLGGSSVFLTRYCIGNHRNYYNG